ncbi:MAG: TonB-dependent receptor [Bacteroidetes bacterium]|nr:TonB-dependent receptor [Bacteroidota bacterium]MBT7825716.1 TonB-dependent receptor [Bacteroidota bacterium]
MKTKLKLIATINITGMMHMKTTKPISKIVLLIGLLIPFLSVAQDSNSIFTGSQEIVRDYIPKFRDAIKLDVIPVNEKVEINKPEITYRVTSSLFPVERELIEKLPAMRLVRPKRVKLNHYYLKGGFGNYNNIIVEGVFNTTKLRDRSLSIHALHNSGKATVKQSNVSEQLFEIDGHKDFRKNTLSGKVFVENNRHHQYGFDPLENVDFDTLNAEQIRQNFLDAGFHLNLTNELTKRSKIRYWTNVSFYNFRDYERLNESAISFNGKIEQYFKENPIRFEATVNQYFISSNPSLSRTYFDVNANYMFIRDNFVAEIGFDAPTEIDSIGSQTHFYPILKIEGRLASNFLYGFAGIKGGLQENTYKSLAYENPFIASNFTLKNTNNKLELFAGLKGSVHEKFRYNTSFSHQTIENLLMFINDSTHSERFLTLYDSSAVNLIKLHAEIELNVINNLQLFAAVNYYQYNKANSSFVAWHMPDVDFKFSAKYHIQHKVYFNIDYFLIGQRSTVDWNTLSVPPFGPNILLKPINDINVGITYKFSDKFGLFFQFNNILNNKYSYWNNYNLRGFHFLAGAKLNL